MEDTTFFMIIDDDKINNLVCESVIKKTNQQYRATSFLRAEDALEYLGNQASQPPFVILLDINMPEMNGWEFLEKYAKLSQNVSKIFLLSSSINHSDIEKSKKYSEIQDYIVKPLSKFKLEQIVEKALQKTI